MKAGKNVARLITQKGILHLFSAPAGKEVDPNSLPVFTTDLDDGSEHTFKIQNLKKLIG